MTGYQNSERERLSCLIRCKADTVNSTSEAAAYWAIAHYGGPLLNMSDPSVGYGLLHNLGFNALTSEAMTEEERQRLAYYIMFNDNW